MKSGFNRFWSVMAILAAVLSASVPVAADAGAPMTGTLREKSKAAAEARTAFTKGVKLYDDGHFAAARDELQRAYDLAPAYKLLYNIGLANKALNDNATAIRAFESYLAEGMWDISDERGAEINAIVDDLMKNVATAKVTSNIPGVLVTIDGAFVGQTPIIDPVLVNPGTHKVLGKLVGRIADERTITAGRGEMLDLSLTLNEAAKPASSQQLVIYVGLAALALVGIVFALTRRKPEAAAAAGPASSKVIVDKSNDEPKKPAVKPALKPEASKPRAEKSP